MSKYVIELNSDYIKSIVAFGMMGDKGMSTVFKIDDLENLNSDYINEHYGQLQDDAYQRGLEEGKALSERGCEGCEYESKTGTCPMCSICSNNYKNYWTAKSPIDDGFARGDVVVDDEDGTRGIVVSSENNESNLLYVLFNGYRTPQSVVQKHYKKTGGHYDIDKYLEEINRSKTDDVC